MAKYDKIGLNYNQTRKADSYITERLLYHLSQKSDGVYLDMILAVEQEIILINFKNQAHLFRANRN